MPPVKSPNKKTTTKKFTQKQELEELEKQRLKEAEEERLRQIEKARGPRSFTDTSFIEECCSKIDHDDLLQYIAKEMRLEDYSLNLKSLIMTDFYIYNIDFVKEHSFVGRKAIKFLTMMEEALKLIIEPLSTQEGAAQYIKQKLLEYSKAEIRSPSPTSGVHVLGEESTTVAQSRPKSSKTEKEKRPKSRGKKKDQEEQERLQREEEERIRKEQELQRKAAEEARTPIFNVEEITTIMDYVTSGILQHSLLYSCIFNVEQQQQLHHYHLTIDTVAETLPLSRMLTLEEHTEKKQQQKEQNELAERLRIEEEIRKKKELEEVARLRYEKEEEELNAPKLTIDQLQEIANYLRYHVHVDLNSKRDELIEKLTEIQLKVETMSRPKSKQGDKKAATKPAKK